MHPSRRSKRPARRAAAKFSANRLAGNGTALDATIAIRDIAGPAAAGSIRLEVVPATTALGGDGYDLTIGAGGIRIAAATPAGVISTTSV